MLVNTLMNGQASKGQRRRRISVEEFAQVNNEIFVDCLEPIPNIPRVTLGTRGTVNPYELNGQIIYLTTSWFVGTDAYEKNIDMVKNMVDLKGQMVLGADWELACGLGRGEDRNTILQKKEEISPTFFALNYESRWVKIFQPLIVAILYSKFGEPRNLGCAYKLKSEYVLTGKLLTSNAEDNPVLSQVGT